MRKDEATREQMFEMILAWRQSGLSQKTFCQQNGIRYHVFHYWYRCYRELQSEATLPGFIPIKVQPFHSVNPSGAHVELLLADGRRLVFHQPVTCDFLKALIN